MIPPSRPSVTRLSDEKVMVRWSVPSSKTGLPIKFFKVQYRMLPRCNTSDNTTNNKAPRSLWRTSNEDIMPAVNMYELDNLKPDHCYRFRIAAVYSNNDNKLSTASTKFELQRGSMLGPDRSHLIAPNLTSVTAISQTSVVLHWLFPEHSNSPVDGFYAYYRPASTAGEYSKATVDGMKRRQFRIDNLEPGTAYEFKLQSFTASAASDFLAILTGKTWCKLHRNGKLQRSRLLKGVHFSCLQLLQRLRHPCTMCTKTRRCRSRPNHPTSHWWLASLVVL